MSDISKAFYDTLKDDATLIADLTKFTANRPSIFTYEPIPKQVVPPYIITAGEFTDEPDLDTKDTEGRVIRRDIRCYQRAEGSAIVVERIASRVRTLFHRVDISITGFKTIYVEVSGPVVFDEEDLYGRILTVKCTLANL